MNPTTLDPRNERWLIAGVAFAAFISSLDGNIVSIALPDISKTLGISIALAAQVMVLFLLFMTASLPMVGKLGALFGSKRVFLSGFFIFGLSSLFCALAPTIHVLIGARIAQAVGSAALLASGYALVAENLPPNRRGMAMGLLGGSASIATIIGAPIGGWMTEAFGWHSIFIINVPLAAIAFAIAWFHLPPDRPASEAEKNAPFDWLGLGFITFGLIGIVHGLNRSDEVGWDEIETWVYFSGGLFFCVAFIWQERRAIAPIIPGSVFQNPQTIFAMIGVGAVTMSLGCLTILGPFFLQNVHQLSPKTVGLIMTCPGLVMMLITPLAGWLSDRLGPDRLGVLASILLALGCVELARLGMQSSVVEICIAFSIVGLSIGLYMPPNSTLVMGLASPEQRSIVASTYNVVKNVGLLLGISVLGAIAYAFIGQKFNTIPEAGTIHSRNALAFGFTVAMWASFALALVTLAMSLLILRKKKSH